MYAFCVACKQAHDILPRHMATIIAAFGYGDLHTMTREGLVPKCFLEVPEPPGKDRAHAQLPE